MARTALLLSVAVAAVTVVALALLWAFQRHLVHLPSGTPGPVERVLPGAREVVLETDDGLRLDGWFLPGPDPQAPAVLVANGNAGHRGLRAPLARELSDRGLAVLLFDYRGYAGNPGSPSEQGLAHDARAAREHLVAEQGVPQERLLYLGESLGAAVVAGLAVEHPPAGLVLRSPFVDLPAVARVHYPVLPAGALLRDRYPVAERVARLDVPTVVVWGSEDEVVPATQSRRVAAAAERLHDTVVVPGAGHNDPALVSGAPLADAVAGLAADVTG